VEPQGPDLEQPRQTALMARHGVLPVLAYCHECHSPIYGQAFLAPGPLCPRCFAARRLGCDGVTGDGKCRNRDPFRLSHRCGDRRWRCDQCVAAWQALDPKDRPKPAPHWLSVSLRGPGMSEMRLVVQREVAGLRRGVPPPRQVPAVIHPERMTPARRTLRRWRLRRQAVAVSGSLSQRIAAGGGGPVIQARG